MAGVQVRWDSPVAAVGGKHANKVIKATGVETVGDLLGIFPRGYVRKGSLSELGELAEGDMLSLVGEVVSSQQKTYQDRRTHRTAYRLEVRVRAEDGSLLLTFFDQQKHTADWRARERVRRHGRHVQRPAEVVQQPVAADQPRLADVRRPDQRRGRDDARPDPALLLGGGGEHLALRGDDRARARPRRGRARRAPAGGARGRGPDRHRPGAALDPPPRHLGAEGQRGEAAEVRRGVRRPDRARPATSRHRGHRRQPASRAVPAGILDAFDERLPFALTDGQRAVGEEISAELGEGHPMHRLLQGEVGSGKTVVALRAMLQVIDSGGQAALLAPTEVLAQQHQRSIVAMLGDLAEGGFLGGAEGATRVALLTGSLNAAARRTALAEAAGGEAGIVIGTHALLEEHVQFADLGLVVVDEQHRFGVEQRAALSTKAGRPPHVLVMTATPIPRTVAMTVFGDLDTSTLSELPAGRGEVQTNVVPTAARPGWLDRAWERVREEVAAGRQAYVVCSRIDPGERRRRATTSGRCTRRGARTRAGGGRARRAPRGDAARPDDARGQGPRDAGVRRAATSTCSSPRRSSRWASTCPTRP